MNTRPLMTIGLLVSVAGCEGAIRGGWPSEADAPVGQPSSSPRGRPQPVGISELQRLTLSQLEDALVRFTGVAPGVLRLPEQTLPGTLPNEAVNHVPSELLIEALLDAAEAVSDAVLNGRSPGLDSCVRDLEPEPDCVRRVLAALARSLHRATATPEEIEAFATSYEARSASVSRREGFRRAIERLVLNPRTLYLLEEGPLPRKLTGVELASRYSLLLHGRVPDEPLLALAERGQLDEPRGRAEVMRALLFDTEGRPDQGATSAIGSWVRAVVQAPPNAEEVTAAAVSVVFEQRGGLATLVGGTLPDAQGAQAAEERRVGLFMQPWFLRQTGGSGETAPFRRGAVILDAAWCVVFGDPPPEAASSLLPSDRGSRRSGLEALTAQPQCAGCHDQINAVGFALDGFGPDGALRSIDEHGHPVDTVVDGTALGLASRIDGAVEMLEALTNHPRMGACEARWLFRWIHGRPAGAADDDWLKALEPAGRGMLSTLVEALSSDGFATRTEGP
jgi:hypothetical protein